MNVVVTGGAGFIGSHLVDALLSRGHRVRVLDDFSNGRVENLPAGADVVDGDVADAETVAGVITDAEVVLHQAALGSVRRSVETPLATNRTNVQGTLAVLEAARGAGTRRVVAASSSSVYGGVAPLPSREDYPPTPRSPYAVTKVTLESYCRVYAQVLGIETVCLRYFNVYGPRQRADSAYAAVVPLFVDALRGGRPVTIHGDGEQSRDFTYVDDVVQANLLAIDAPADRCSGRVYNIAGGARHTVLELLATIGDLLGVEPEAEHTEARLADVRDSEADLTAARTDLGYDPRFSLRDGLRRLLETTAP